MIVELGESWPRCSDDVKHYHSLFAGDELQFGQFCSSEHQEEGDDDGGQKCS